VVLAERPAAQPQQVGGADYHPTASRYVNCVVSVCRRCRPVSGGGNEGSRRDRRLTFESHVTAVARACNYHTQAIRHIRHFLTTELVLTLTCSLILSRLDYCNAVLYGAAIGSIK